MNVGLQRRYELHLLGPRQERRVAQQLPQKTQDSPVQSSPGLCMASPLAPPHPSYSMFYVFALKNRAEQCVPSYPSYLCCVQGMG